MVKCSYFCIATQRKFILQTPRNMSQKPSIPKGTRDFLPHEVSRREYIFDTIKTQFKRFGFQPIETPSFEKRETLLGKYGEEGDRLIFRILNSGNFLNNHNVLLEGYLRGIINRIIEFEYTNRFRNDSSSERMSSSQLIDYLSSEQFVNNIFEPVKEKFKGTSLQNFYSQSLENVVKTEITRFIQNDELVDSLIDVFDDCSDCSPLDNTKIQELIENWVKIIFGEYYMNSSQELSQHISEKALRYDLTVPFARFVVQHQNEISFPFKRYQIQPVWRADRPQHGRYQEFYQCDADVVGSDSLLYELECVQLFDEVLTKLRIPDFTIKINNRKILSGLAEVCGASDKLTDLVVALDKLDKIGKEGVIKEWQERGLTNESIAIVEPLLEFSGSFEQKIQVIKDLLANSQIGQLGITELEFVFDQVSQIGLKNAKIEFDVTLARGLNYYTGAIFEVVANGVNMGSICGGGRYDDLTGLFGLSGVSGVGISFGADRIYDVLNMLELYPEELNHGLTLLFANFGIKEQSYCLNLLRKVRDLGVDAELYPSYEAKIKKQLKYADDRRTKYVVLIGESELEKGTLLFKNMQTGEQEELEEVELIKRFVPCGV